MVSRKKNIFDRAQQKHPLKVLIYVAIAGIVMLFFTMMVLFAFYHPGTLLHGKPFPKAFWGSTAAIITSSFTIETAWRAYRRDDSQKLLNSLMLTMGLALVFTVLQYFGWTQLWESGITLYDVPSESGAQASPAGAFLFVISGLHVLHLGGGLVFLFLAMFRAVNVRGDDVRSVVYFSDRLEATRLEMLAKYWHFLGALWIVLLLYFRWFFR